MLVGIEFSHCSLSSVISKLVKDEYFRLPARGREKRFTRFDSSDE